MDPGCNTFPRQWHGYCSSRGNSEYVDGNLQQTKNEITQANEGSEKTPLLIDDTELLETPVKLIEDEQVRALVASPYGRCWNTSSLITPARGSFLKLKCKHFQLLV